MRLNNGGLGFGLALSAFALVVACGAAPDEVDTNGSNVTSRNPNDPRGGFGGSSSGGEEGLGTTVPDLAACATSTAKAEASRVYLVFMFDRSGSMLEDDRWQACKGATESFFGAAESAGISASLHYFPIMGLLLPSCDSARYALPAVPMTSLPNGAFKSSLDKEAPNGGTPTGPALAGAIKYAKQMKQGEAKDGKVAIVLVSDGDPEGCGDDLTSVSKLAKDAAPSIPTYVIGVGDVSSLDAIAKAGGTKSAFIVPANDPEKTRTELLSAMNEIRSAALSCDYSIPPAPGSEKLDRDKVNVVHKPKGGKEEALLKNQTCEGGKGWRYDDPDDPTRILICEGSCETLKATPGQIDVVFGCETQTGDVK